MSDATLGFIPGSRWAAAGHPTIKRSYLSDAYRQFYRQVYCQFLPLLSGFDNNFRQWSDICRAIIPVNMDKTSKWPDILSTSRQQFSTTQIRRYDDGSVLYFTLCVLVLCFLNAMGFNWCISVWWFYLAGALQASRF